MIDNQTFLYMAINRWSLKIFIIALTVSSAFLCDCKKWTNYFVKVTETFQCLNFLTDIINQHHVSPQQTTLLKSFSVKEFTIKRPRTISKGSVIEPNRSFAEAGSRAGVRARRGRRARRRRRRRPPWLRLWGALGRQRRQRRRAGRRTRLRRVRDGAVRRGRVGRRTVLARIYQSQFSTRGGTRAAADRHGRHGRGLPPRPRPLHERLEWHQPLQHTLRRKVSECS